MQENEKLLRKERRKINKDKGKKRIQQLKKPHLEKNFVEIQKN
jgi:hypothetical protein